MIALLMEKFRIELLESHSIVFVHVSYVILNRLYSSESYASKASGFI